MSDEPSVIAVSDRLRLSRHFTRVPQEIIADDELSEKAKMVWITLWSFCYDCDTSFPGLSKVAEILNTTTKTVRKYRKELEEAGLVDTERRGRGKTNVYKIYTHYGGDPKGTSEQDPKGASDPTVNNTKYKEDEDISPLSSTNVELSIDATVEDFKEQQGQVVNVLSETCIEDDSKCWSMAGRWINMYDFELVASVLQELLAKNKLEEIDNPIAFVGGCLEYNSSSDDETDQFNEFDDLPDYDTYQKWPDDKKYHVASKIHPHSNDPINSVISDYRKAGDYRRGR